ncbi:MAG TPA: signal peptidase I [Actinomycetota bacterium]
MSEIGFSAGVTTVRASASPRTLARLAACAVLWTIGGLLLGLCLAITLPNLVGDRSLTVMSGSMDPTLRVGDVVIVNQISPLDAKIGDVVTFRDPSNPTRLVTHRVRDIEISNGVVRFVTKGDANTSVEHWKIPTNGTIGRVAYHVPGIGYALFWIRGRFGRLLLVVIPALLLGAYELWRIWRPSREELEVPEEVTADAVT